MSSKEYIIAILVTIFSVGVRTLINLEALLKSSSVKRYPKDTAFVREGSRSGDTLYYIIQGSAGAYKNYGLENEVLVSTLNAGGFFGEMSLFAEEPSEVTVVAQADLNLVLAIDRQNMNEIFSTQPDITVGIIGELCKRISALNAGYAELSAKIGGGAFVIQEKSRRSALFPEGHGTYKLPIDNDKNDYLFEENFTCPVCGRQFMTMSMLSSRLRRDKTDKDLRVYYKDFEPMYYEVTTCPNCFYSMQTESFKQGSRRWVEDIANEIEAFRADLEIKTGKYRDTFAVFAGYYLALICAPICCDDPRLVTANLWLKLSRLYDDCGDAAMAKYAWEQSLADYHYSYEHYRTSEKQSQQLCYLMGDLYQKLGDLNEARNFFFMAKANKAGTPVMVRMADNRLEDIREIIQNQKRK
jgi:uncharacterized protein (DUF2225 family)/CRP-like cAMP-binding protein